jgi:hypothetical protein
MKSTVTLFSLSATFAFFLSLCSADPVALDFGGFPPVLLRAVCLVRAMVEVFILFLFVYFCFVL